MSFIGKTVFISYRGKYYDQAALLGASLVNSGMCQNIVIFPPNILCAHNEVITPYEYVEIMGNMRDAMSSCNAFVYLNTHDYANSYFTQAELLQWQLYKDMPSVHAAGNDNDGNFVISAPIQLETASRNTKSLWAGIVTSIDRSQKHHLSSPFIGGKYNRNTFIVIVNSKSIDV